MSVPWAEKDYVPMQPFDHLMDRLGAHTVFGQPVAQDGVTVIPVAEVSMAFGFGKGGGPVEMASEAGPGVLPAGGGGGGGAGKATPRGYIKIAADGVTYDPMVDATRMGLAGMLFAAWTVFWVTLTIRAEMKAHHRSAE